MDGGAPLGLQSEWHGIAGGGNDPQRGEGTQHPVLSEPTDCSGWLERAGCGVAADATSGEALDVKPRSLGCTVTRS